MENKKAILEQSFDRFRDTRYYDLIREFYLDLSYYLDEEHLEAFYNNIGTLRIDKLKWFSPNLGEYIMSSNTIRLPSKIVDTSTILHELLHMASSFKRNGYLYGGFHCPFGSDYHGYALNEGYTELTNIRLFGDEIKKDHVYETEIAIVKLVEKLVGKEKLQDMYFKANLRDLINNLKKYSNYSSARDFVIKSDMISDRDINLVRKLKEDQMTDAIKYIVDYLIKSYIYKMYVNYREGYISQSDAILFFDNFVNDAFSLLKSPLTFKKYIVEDTLYDNYEQGKKILKK